MDLPISRRLSSRLCRVLPVMLWSFACLAPRLALAQGGATLEVRPRSGAPATPSPTSPLPITSARTPLDGPWSGQAQCVITTRGPNYQEEQTHTWRIIGGAPQVVGSIRRFPAVWSVQGGGTRTVAVATGSTTTREERWTISVPDTSAPISVWEIPGYRGNNRIRIGSQHGLLVASNAIRPNTGSLAFSIQEWLFPAAEDEMGKTTLSGMNTATFPVGPAWRRPDKVPSDVACTWNFTRADVDVSSRGTLLAPATAVLGNPNAPGVTIAVPSTPTSPAANQPAAAAAPGAGVRAPTAGMTAIAAGTRGSGAVLSSVTNPCEATIADVVAMWDRFLSDITSFFAKRLSAATSDAERTQLEKERAQAVAAATSAKTKSVESVVKMLESTTGCELPEAFRSAIVNTMQAMSDTLGMTALSTSPSVR